MRPVLHALIAKDLGGGQVGRSRLVDLATAYLAVKSRLYVCVGPDPEDMEALARWEIDNGHRPKWHR